MLEILTSHTNSVTQDLVKTMFGHVAEVVTDKLKMLARQESLGLACIKIDIGR